MKKPIILMAGVLIFFILVGSVVLHLSGAMQGGKFSQQELWQQAVTGGPPETLKAIDLTGDGEDEVFVHTPGELLILSPDGGTLLQQNPLLAKSTMGDFNGDGVDEFAVAEPIGSDLLVTVWTAAGQALWQTPVENVGEPARGIALDLTGDGRREVIFGTVDGHLVCLDGAAGGVLWHYTFPPDTSENMLVRGTDDIVWGGRTYLAAADYGGYVVLLDRDREVIWQLQFPEQLRRMRAFDMNGDGTSEIFLGGLNGLVHLVSAENGDLLWSNSVGGRVNEARFLELDGDPSQTELAVGNRYGGLFVYNLAGENLWRHTVGGKVLEFATLDLESDGQNELLVAGDSISLLEGNTGDSLDTYAVTEPTTMDVGDFGKHNAYLVGTGSAVMAVEVSYQSSPWWYSPITAGLLLALVIAAVAVWLSRFERAPQAPKVVYSVQDMSLEALKARKTMLREVLQDVERMQRDGEISTEVYLARTRTLHEQLAAVDEGILAIQPDYKPDTMQCPSCGAPLQVGLDRCPYCAHVLL
jgi:outer membrane protein assembly factor BamB